LLSTIQSLRNLCKTSSKGSKSTIIIYLWIDKEAGGGPSRKSWVPQLMGGLAFESGLDSSRRLREEDNLWGSRVLEKGKGGLFIHALFVVACSLQAISMLVSRTFSMAYYAGSIRPGRMHMSLMQQDFLVLEIVLSSVM
jgi:hypothetical protein